MTTHTPAPAQAAEQILDAIRSAGYRDHPTNIERKRVDAIISAVTPLLSKLRAPVADERDRNATISEVVGLCNRIPGATTWNAAEFMYDEMHRRAALASAPVAGEAQHSDDAAVDRFAVAMKAKLAAKRAAGRGGWDDKAQCSNEWLSSLLRQHLEKGDPLDVANFAMMLHQRGERIIPYRDAPEASEAVNAAMADEYRRWIDYYHQGRDYDDFLKECVYGHKPAPVDTSSGLNAVPQASEAQCSCPSGDGSVRHPCAVHPQASEAVRDADRQQASAPLLKAARRAVLALAAAAERDPAFQGDYDALSAALSAQPGAQKNGGGDGR